MVLRATQRLDRSSHDHPLSLGGAPWRHAERDHFALLKVRLNGQHP
jgi:hypothetical protein